MITKAEIVKIVSQITYKKGWNFSVKGDFNAGLFLQIHVANGVCSVSGEPVSWASGKRYLSPFMCKQEIVGVCFSLVKAAEEHEMLEFFRYKGASIFNPHLDPDKLAELAKYKANFVCRPDNQSMTMDN